MPPQERKFVPYRNSMMTSVLRDSLGGNCKTVMVATMSTEESYLDETISTCRFAQVQRPMGPRHGTPPWQPHHGTP